MPRKTPEKRAADAAAMRARVLGSNAVEPPEIPAYASAETLAAMLDCSRDEVHRRFRHLPGVVPLGGGRIRKRWRYPMAEVKRELERLRCSG